jgi:hypothetical protein
VPLDDDDIDFLSSTPPGGAPRGNGGRSQQGKR